MTCAPGPGSPQRDADRTVQRGRAGEQGAGRVAVARELGEVAADARGGDLRGRGAQRDQDVPYAVRPQDGQGFLAGQGTDVGGGPLQPGMPGAVSSQPSGDRNERLDRTGLVDEGRGVRRPW